MSRRNGCVVSGTKGERRDEISARRSRVRASIRLQHEHGGQQFRSVHRSARRPRPGGRHPEVVDPVAEGANRAPGAHWRGGPPSRRGGSHGFGRSAGSRPHSGRAGPRSASAGRCARRRRRPPSPRRCTCPGRAPRPPGGRRPGSGADGQTPAPIAQGRAPRRRSRSRPAEARPRPGPRRPPVRGGPRRPRRSRRRAAPGRGAPGSRRCSVREFRSNQAARAGGTIATTPTGSRPGLMRRGHRVARLRVATGPAPGARRAAAAPHRLLQVSEEGVPTLPLRPGRGQGRRPPRRPARHARGMSPSPARARPAS